MPMVNGKKYPYTEEGKKKAKKAAMTKKESKSAPKKATPAPKVKAPYGGRGEADMAREMKEYRKKMGFDAPSKAMNKAIPGNPGANLGSAAKKFVMSMPPVAVARGAAKVGMAAGKAINNAMNPPKRQMKRMPGTLGDRITGRPAPVAPKRKPKQLFPKKPGR